MNNLYQQLHPQASPSLPNNLGQIKNMMNMMRAARNPQQFLMNMAQNNPKMQQVMNVLQSGQNPKELFYKMAQEQGIDPNMVAQQLGLK